MPTRPRATLSTVLLPTDPPTHQPTHPPTGAPLALIEKNKVGEPDYDQWVEWGNDILTTGIFAIILCGTLGERRGGAAGAAQVHGSAHAAPSPSPPPLPLASHTTHRHPGVMAIHFSAPVLLEPAGSGSEDDEDLSPTSPASPAMPASPAYDAMHAALGGKSGASMLTSVVAAADSEAGGPVGVGGAAPTAGATALRTRSHGSLAAGLASYDGQQQQQQHPPQASAPRVCSRLAVVAARARARSVASHTPIGLAPERRARPLAHPASPFP